MPRDHSSATFTDAPVAPGLTKASQSAAGAPAAAEAFALLGERWNMAILNELADGPLRSAELERRLGIPGPTLRGRIRTLIAHALLERRPYVTRPPRFEYRLTQLGWKLYPALAHIAEWGENDLAAAADEPLSGWRSEDSLAAA